MAEQFLIRAGTLADAETVVAHRRAMFLAMGYPDDDAMQAMIERFRPWLLAKMRAEEYLAWFAVDRLAVANDQSVAAGLGMWLMDWPPHLLGLGRWRPNILNVYTRPESRRQGLARRLVEHALAWCRANHLSTVILHASAAGRPLYQSMGFQPTSEMRLILKLE